MKEIMLNFKEINNTALYFLVSNCPQVFKNVLSLTR